MSNRLPSSRSPLLRLVSAFVLLAIFAVSFFLGVVVFLAVLGISVFLALVLYLRFWWLRRSWDRQRRAREQGRGVTLEGEYTRRDREDR